MNPQKTPLNSSQNLHPKNSQATLLMLVCPKNRPLLAGSYMVVVMQVVGGMGVDVRHFFGTHLGGLCPGTVMYSPQSSLGLSS